MSKFLKIQIQLKLLIIIVFVWAILFKDSNDSGKLKNQIGFAATVN